MKTVKVAAGGSALAVIGLLLFGGQPSSAQAPPSPAAAPLRQFEFMPEVKHDLSPPLRLMTPIPPYRGPHLLRTLGHVHPVHPYEAMNDPVRQIAAPKAWKQPTTAGLSFAGVGQGDYGFSVGAIPPDTEGSVGDTQYVQWINFSFAVFNKSNGALLYGPVSGNTLWQGFGGVCQSNNNGDPIAQFDKNAHRWVMGQFAFTSETSGPFYECVAVSATSDATGQWYRYQLQSNLFDDYPKIATWPDAYYLSFNNFDTSLNFVGSTACAFDRTAMLAGQSASSICFATSAPLGGFLPSDWDGSTPPPSGEPDFYLEWDSSTLLNLFRFHVDFTTPANSTFSGPTGITVASFSDACGGGNCIPQPGTPNVLDSLADRLMYRLAYRHYADHESLVTNQAVGSPAGIRWYEIRDPNGTPAVYQQGTYAPDSNWRWMGSAAMDQAGDLVVGYSVSNSGPNSCTPGPGCVYPSIAYAGRLPGDTLGTLEAETSVLTGSGSQINGVQRWGDYSAMTIDPADDCTFWYTDMYLKKSGSFNWSTWINSFTFNSCSGYTVSAGSAGAIAAGQSAHVPVTLSPVSGFSGTVKLSATGLPAGATATFNPSSVSAPGSSTLTISTTGATPLGAYTVWVTGISGINSESAATGLQVTGTPQASLSPTSLGFGIQIVAAPSSPLVVGLTNGGTAGLTISSITAGGDFGETNNCGSSVAAGTSCQINVTFTPSGGGPSKALLSVNDNAGSGVQTVILTGVGTVVGLAPSSLSFPNQSVGSSSTAQTVTVKNQGSATVHLWQIALGSANRGDYLLNNSCGSSLAAGAQCAVGVTFKPTASGTRIASVLFSDDGGGSPQSVSLTGDGLLLPLKASSNNRYLVDQNGTPFLIMGDAPQSLVGNLSAGDMKTYLADRERLGFNALWVNLLCASYTGCNSNGTTYDGVAPFTSGSGPSDYDLATPNSAFFSRVDSMVNLAATFNLVVFLDPIETGGWLVTLENNGSTKAYNYGVYIGNRYKNFANIVWLHGNDFQTWSSSSTDNNLVKQVMAGIASVDSHHLQTIELNYNSSYSNQDSALGSLLTLDSAYTYYETYDIVLQSYNSSPTVPTYLVEANYEYENNTGALPSPAGPYVLREEAYWTILSGAAGQLYGSHYTWTFTTGWQSFLDSPGALEIQYLNQLFGSVNWWNLVPDATHQVVTAGYGTYNASNSNLATATYCTTSWITSGSLALTYCPNASTLTVNLAEFSGQVTAQWYDPSSGAYAAISGSPFANSGTHNFTTPGNNHDGNPDWVLELAAGGGTAPRSRTDALLAK
ncbi:MAG: DUF4038 domain-containing protein [Terriglobia bacterium]